MANPTLTGTEVFQVQATRVNGLPAATTQQTTTAAIAALAAGGAASTVITSINTVGAGVLTAAGIYGKITNRTGTQVAAFTDTTDTAANILAQIPLGSQITGIAFIFCLENNTAFPETVTGGVGVTVSGVTVIPANSWGGWLVTLTNIATPTATMVGFEQGYFPHVGTFTANGATPVTVTDANATAGSQVSVTLRTVGGSVGTSAPNVRTITAGTGFTIAGIAGDTSVYNYEIRG